MKSAEGENKKWPERIGNFSRGRRVGGGEAFKAGAQAETQGEDRSYISVKTMVAIRRAGRGGKS